MDICLSYVNRKCCKQAIERGEGSGENWEEYRQRLMQAEADATTFQAAMQQAASARQVTPLP